MKNVFSRVIGLFKPADTTTADQATETESRPVHTSGHRCCQHSDTVKLPTIWSKSPPPPRRVEADARDIEGIKTNHA